MGKNLFKLNLTIFSFQIKQNIAVYSKPGAAEAGRQWGPVPPPPPLFLKVKKVPSFLGLNAPFKERKKYFLNKLPLFLFVRLMNVIKSFDFGHIQKCPFWSMPLHFRNASADSVANCFTGSHLRQVVDIVVDKRRWPSLYHSQSFKLRSRKRSSMTSQTQSI
jgi:hypothetical protein